MQLRNNEKLRQNNKRFKTFRKKTSEIRTEETGYVVNRRQGILRTIVVKLVRIKNNRRDKAQHRRHVRRRCKN